MHKLYEGGEANVNPGLSLSSKTEGKDFFAVVLKISYLIETILCLNRVTSNTELLASF